MTLSHTTFSHTHTTLLHTTLLHTTLSHTAALSHNLSSTISFVFPAGPIPFSPLFCAYWMKLTCGVIRSFSVLLHVQTSLEKGYSCPTYSIACFDIPQKIPCTFCRIWRRTVLSWLDCFYHPQAGQIWMITTCTEQIDVQKCWWTGPSKSRTLLCFPRFGI